MTRSIQIVVVILTSAGLLYALGSRAELTWSDVVHTISNFPVWAFVCVVALTGMNVTLGTFKWLLAMRAVAPIGKSNPRFIDALLTTALGGMLGQAMPVQVGVALTRSVAGRLGVGWSPGANLSTTTYEQLFDVIVLFAAAMAGLFGQILSAGPISWMVLILLFGAIAIFGSKHLRLLLTVISGLVYRVPHGSSSAVITSLHTALTGAAGLSSSVVAQLTTLSVLRYFVNLGRVVAVLAGLGILNYAVPAVIGFPLVQTIGLLPVTPGNLGLIEWTWSAVLMSAGASMGGAAVFAITTRIVNVSALSILIMILCGICCFRVTRANNWRWR